MKYIDYNELTQQLNRLLPSVRSGSIKALYYGHPTERHHDAIKIEVMPTAGGTQWGLRRVHSDGSEGSGEYFPLNTPLDEIKKRILEMVQYHHKPLDQRLQRVLDESRKSRAKTGMVLDEVELRFYDPINPNDVKLYYMTDQHTFVALPNNDVEGAMAEIKKVFDPPYNQSSGMLCTKSFDSNTLPHCHAHGNWDAFEPHAREWLKRAIEVTAKL